jgi:hypothetical protein
MPRIIVSPESLGTQLARFDRTLTADTVTPEELRRSTKRFTAFLLRASGNVYICNWRIRRVFKYTNIVRY